MAERLWNRHLKSRFVCVLESRKVLMDVWADQNLLLCVLHSLREWLTGRGVFPGSDVPTYSRAKYTAFFSTSHRYLSYVGPSLSEHETWPPKFSVSILYSRVGRPSERLRAPRTKGKAVLGSKATAIARPRCSSSGNIPVRSFCS